MFIHPTEVSLILIFIHLSVFWTWSIIIFQRVASGSCNSLEQTLVFKQREILKAEQSNKLSAYETLWNISETMDQGKVCYNFCRKQLFWCKNTSNNGQRSSSVRLIHACRHAQIRPFNNTCISLFIHLNLWKW